MRMSFNLFSFYTRLFYCKRRRFSYINELLIIVVIKPYIRRVYYTLILITTTARVTRDTRIGK